MDQPTDSRTDRWSFGKVSLPIIKMLKGWIRWFLIYHINSKDAIFELINIDNLHSCWCKIVYPWKSMFLRLGITLSSNSGILIWIYTYICIFILCVCCNQKLPGRTGDQPVWNRGQNRSNACQNNHLNATLTLECLFCLMCSISKGTFSLTHWLTDSWAH